MTQPAPAGGPLQDRRWGLWLVLALAIAAETRFLGLADRSLWFDEAFSLAVARLPLPLILRFVRGADTHPPLFYWLLGLWTHLFGSSEVAARGFSALMSFAMVPLLYGFARRLVDRDVALVGALLLAGSSFAIRAGQEARMYPLLGLLTLGSWYALVVTIERRRLGYWAAYVIVTALAPYAHYYGFMVLGSQVLYVLPRWRRDRSTFGAAVLAQGAVLALFAPWAAVFITQLLSGFGWPTIRPPADLRAVADLLALFGFGGELLGTGGYFHTSEIPLWQGALLVVPILGLVGAGLYALRGERAWLLFCYWGAPILAALVISQRYNIFYTRYFSFLAPAYALVVAVGLDRIARTLPRVSRGVATAALVVLILAVNVPVTYGYVWRNLNLYDWRDAATLVTARASSNDYLLFVPGFGQIPFEYYYKGKLGRYELTPVEVYQAVGIQQPPLPKVQKAWVHDLAETHPHVWVVETAPVSERAGRRLQQLLGDVFEPRTAWDFKSVYVLLLESRLYRGHGDSP